MFTKLKSPVLITLAAITLVLLFCEYNFRWKNEQWKYAVHTDAANYYRYLPMVFINHQLDSPAENPVVIKYYVGTAITYSPFFAIACIVSAVMGLPVDGYSMLFPILISIGTLFYFVLGLLFFAKFLRFYLKDEISICFSLITLTFGTVAYYYTVLLPGWAHIPAFSVICFLLYHLKKLTVEFQRSSIAAIIIASSLLFFIRPTDITVLLLAPFLAKDFKSFLDLLHRIFKEKKTIAGSILLALIPLACQLSIYRISAGEFFVWSYNKEGFDFLHPEVINVLFSYAKGFFVYTPICLAALFGLFPLYNKNRYLFTGVLVYLSLSIYIISSWWCWNYGFSYGPRAFIELFPVFFLLLALLFESSLRVIKNVLIASSFLLCVLSLFQIYQASNGILDSDYKTDKKGYWDVFLRTDRGYSGKFYRVPVNEEPQNVKKRLTFFNDMEKTDTTWLNPYSQVNEKAYSGLYSSKVNKDSWYGTGIRKYLRDIPYNKNVLIRCSGWFYVPKRGSKSYFACSFVKGGKGIRFIPFDLEGYTEQFDRWEYHEFEVYMPKFSAAIEQDPTSQVEFYYFNNSEMNCYCDDLKVEFVEYAKLDRVLDLSWE